MDYATFTVERRGQADWVTLNRPDVLNAISLQMVHDLHAYFGHLHHDRDTRVVVLRGAGKAFCAGLDIRERSTDGDTPPFAAGFGFQGYLAEVYVRMRRCPQPIVALVHGAACGGGFSLALASDIRIAGESARMNAAFIKLGLSACDMGCSYFLPRLVGASVASELMLTGRFIHAPRALATGLVSQVVPDDELEEAGECLVADLLGASPMGLRMTKEGLNFAIDAPSLEAAIALENRNQLMTAASPNFREGMKAFLEKRRPDYAAE
ncbi:MAG: enoyl-CoA hydratase/isomerase family protein [Novosphingobium sp.]